MIRKYENFMNSKEKNILNLAKKDNRNDNSSNKNILNSNRSKIKNKNKEKSKKNVFKTINILHDNKKFMKNNKNEKNIRLSLGCHLLNNVRNINMNNIQKYNNNKIFTNNYLNNKNKKSFNEENKKEKGKSTNTDNCHWEKKIKIKKNIKSKTKNLSHINITNLINNKYRINNSSLTKTRSTENINNLTKNYYNKSLEYESNLKDMFNKKIPLKEKNINYIKYKNYHNKKINILNSNSQKKSINKCIKTIYNTYKSNPKSSKRKKGRKNNSGFKNIYKNSEKFLSGIKINNKYKTPQTHKKLFQSFYNNFNRNKKETFNLFLFDNLYIKAKEVLEKCKNTLELQIKHKSYK